MMVHDMKQRRKLLRNVSIRSRLLFGFIALPLVVMIICFLLYYNFSMQMIISKNQESSQHSVEMVEELFHLNMERLEDQMTEFCAQGIVYDMLLSDGESSVRKNFVAYAKMNMNLNGRNRLVLFNEKQEVIYDDAGEKEQGNLSLPSTLDISWAYKKEHNGIFLTKRIVYHNETIGYVCGGFKEGAFSSSFTNASSISNMMIIIDKDNHYLFGQAAFPKGKNIQISQDMVNVNGKSYYHESKQIEGMDWKVVNLVSSEYVLQEIHSTRNMLFLYGVAILILEAILSTIVYHSIYDPIHNILVSMRKLDETNLISSQVEDNGKDEVHELSENFNDLLNRVQELVKTVALEQEQKRETQLQLLQAQINPHFLFNTLNTLHYLAILNEDNPVSEGISALSKLLCNTIVDSNEYVDVEEEIENVKNYIIIQKLRYGDLFETVYNIDEDVRHCRILKFLLQPIVENSILHAFEEDREHQILTIRAQAEKGCLKIEIGDNGKGFQEVEQSYTNKKLSGIGIMNIQERIRLMYGDKYSMNIQSEVNKGTIVTLLLPYRKGGITDVQGIDSR